MRISNPRWRKISSDGAFKASLGGKISSDRPFKSSIGRKISSDEDFKSSLEEKYPPIDLFNPRLEEKYPPIDLSKSSIGGKNILRWRIFYLAFRAVSSSVGRATASGC
jgi:hypothetical protein